MRLRLHGNGFALGAMLAVIVGNGAITAGQGPPRRHFRNQDEIRKWADTRNAAWDTFARNARKPHSGLTLSAWLTQGAHGRLNEIELILSLRNVGDSDLEAYAIGGQPPQVLVRDSFGKPAALSTQGIGFYSQALLQGSSRMATLKPGDSIGRRVEIGTDFSLVAGKEYTILAGSPVGELFSDTYVVANPVQLRLEQARDAYRSGGVVLRRTTETRGESRDEPGDAEWKKFRVYSARRIRWCVLEQMFLPDDKRGPLLAVSLTCVEQGGWEEPSLTRAQATAYTLLMRGPRGQRRALDLSGVPDAARANTRFPRDKFSMPAEGSGIGSLIALREYIKADEVGDWWLMAALSPQNAADPPWVAAPIKVRIEPKARAPKK